MAKKNKVVLMGFIHEIISQDPLLFTLKIRKNPRRFVYPIIELGEETKDLEGRIKPRTLVVVEGKVTTQQREEKYDCPNPSCHEKITDRYIFTKVTADSIKFVKELERNSNVYINQVFLLGVVCREKDFRYITGTKSPLGHTKYQLAVNRREPNATDYPWVASFVRQAEEDARRLQIGSQVLIDGILNTRKNAKECSCTVCKSKIEVSEPLTEVVSNTVEYLNNCIFDDE